MSEWVSVSDGLPEEWEKVDVWMSWHASPMTMGMADDFRCPNAWRQGGKWMHSHRDQPRELNAEYITHWTPIPDPPEAA